MDNHMKYLISILLVVISFGANAHKQKLPAGALVAKSKVYIKAGEEYVVPRCKKLLLKDFQKLTDLTWLKIDGKLEFVTNDEYYPKVQHSIEGKFKYTTGSNRPDQLSIISSGSKVVLFSKESVTKIEAMEFTWMYPDNSLCAL